MKRRDFLKTTAVAAAGTTIASRLGFSQNITEPGAKPNILFILVDELRWPSVFPAGVNSAEEYFRRFMPNLYKYVWKGGVKFSNYHTAACACTPARGTILTGLYSHQSWLISTILSNPNLPVLNPAFPTFGKLLCAAGYTTPYYGKWHVSIPSGPSDTAPYGFAWNSPPDVVGFNLQGTYGDPIPPPPPPNPTEPPPYHNDAYTTSQVISYLQNVKTTDAPWCLTVGYVNPHDREFYPAGTEFLTYTNVFANYNQNKPPSAQLKQFTDYTTTPPIVNWNINKLKSPPPQGYPFLPPTGRIPLTTRHSTNPPRTPTFSSFQPPFGEALLLTYFSSASRSILMATVTSPSASATRPSTTGNAGLTATPRSPRSLINRSAPSSINSTSCRRASSTTPSSSSPPTTANTVGRTASFRARSAPSTRNAPTSRSSSWIPAADSPATPTPSAQASAPPSTCLTCSSPSATRATQLG